MDQVYIKKNTIDDIWHLDVKDDFHDICVKNNIKTISNLTLIHNTYVEYYKLKSDVEKSNCFFIKSVESKEKKYAWT